MRIGDGQADQWRLCHRIFTQKEIDAHLRHVGNRLANVGTGIIHVSESPYSVKADKLYILRHAYPELLQRPQNMAGETVGNAENAVKG